MADAQIGTYQDPNEKKIEDARKAGKILTPADFSSQGMRDALYRLNMKNSTKDDSAATTAKKQQAENAAKPMSFKKGGMVQKTGMAKVHKGERVLTATQQKALKAKKAGAKANVKSKIANKMTAMYTK